MGISRDEWLSALGEAAAPSDPDALTIQELCDQFGVCRSVATRRVNELVEQGRAVRTIKAIRRSNGYSARVAAFRLIPAPKKRKAA